MRNPASRQPPHGAIRPPPLAGRGASIGLARSALVGLSSAMAIVALGVNRALAVDLSSEDGLITETIATRERMARWDDAKPAAAADGVPDAFKPTGVKAGNFRVLPSLGALVIYDDNIFASNLDRRADLRTELTPEVKIRSDFSRHELDLSLGGKIVTFLENSDQNYENVYASARGALHFDHAHTLSAEALSSIEHEERHDVTASRFASGPVEIFHNRATVGITRDVARLYGTLSAGAESWSYSDIKASDGSIIDESARDLTVVNGTAKIGYRFSPGYEFVTRLRMSRQYNPGDGIVSHDGWGYDVTAGIAFNQGPILRWQLLGGYGLRQYDQPGIADVGSSLLEADVTWFASPNLTFRGMARRALVDELAADGNGSRVENIVSARLEYLLWHNLLFNAGLSYGEDQFTGSNRLDRRLIAGASFDFHMSKNWLFTIGYQHEVRNSTDDAYDMTRNRYMVGAKLRF